MIGVDVFTSINPLLGAYCVLDFALARIRHRLLGEKEIDTFESWVVSRFGRTLYNIYFGPYTRKLWGRDPSQLSGVFEVYLTSLRASDEYRTEIVPRAEQAYRLYLDRFQEMAAAYPQVLIAQRTLFQTSERYLRAIEDAHRAALQIQGFLLVDGLEAPPAPGQTETGIRTGELPGAVRSGELPLAVRTPGEQ